MFLFCLFIYLLQLSDGWLDELSVVGSWLIGVVVGCIWTNWVSKDNFGNCCTNHLLVSNSQSLNFKLFFLENFKNLLISFTRWDSLSILLSTLGMLTITANLCC